MSGGGLAGLRRCSVSGGGLAGLRRCSVSGGGLFSSRLSELFARSCGRCVRFIARGCVSGRG